MGMRVSRRGAAKLPEYDSAYVKAGVLQGATYPAATITPADGGKPYPDPRAGKAVAPYAAALHFGTSKIPARPFIAQPAASHRGEWADLVSRQLRGGASVEKSLGLAGIAMRDAIQEAITSWPGDNSAKWAAVKGFNHGLIQTSHLLHSIEYEVVAE